MTLTPQTHGTTGDVEVRRKGVRRSPSIWSNHVNDAVHPHKTHTRWIEGMCTILRNMSIPGKGRSGTHLGGAIDDPSAHPYQGVSGRM